MRGSIWLGAAVLSAAGALGAPLALAQSPGPGANEIIRSLTPRDHIDSTTRGIRMRTPSNAAPHAPSVSLNILFATGSAELTPAARAELDELGRALSAAQLASYRFRIEGHTDTVGTAAANQSLSERRAATVVGYLEGKFNIDPHRLEAVGMGERGLLVATPDQTPEPRNRRVMVVNLGS